MYFFGYLNPVLHLKIWAGYRSVKLSTSMEEWVFCGNCADPVSTRVTSRGRSAVLSGRGIQRRCDATCCVCATRTSPQWDAGTIFGPSLNVYYWQWLACNTAILIFYAAILISSVAILVLYVAILATESLTDSGAGIVTGLWVLAALRIHVWATWSAVFTGEDRYLQWSWAIHIWARPHWISAGRGISFLSDPKLAFTIVLYHSFKPWGHEVLTNPLFHLEISTGWALQLQ